jgi:hypothetical protein
MIKRLRESSSKGNLPNRHDPQTGHDPGLYAHDPGHYAHDPGEYGDRGLLTPRSAGILGASAAIAACTGSLTYLSLGHLSAGLPTALLAAGAAFAGAIRLLNGIIA